MIQEFRKSINDSTQIRALHQHCVEELKLPGEYGDLLRMSFVYCMSALDKLIHDIVIYGMVEIYVGRSQPTPKYFAEGISIESHGELIISTVPPPEIVFEGIIRRKIGHQSYMDPNKLSDALSLVWLENHKWQAISNAMGRNKQNVTTELRNIFQRRNAIVHESDKDPVTNHKMLILAADSKRMESFILELGETIHRLCIVETIN